MNPTEPAVSAKPVFGPATAVLALAVSGRWRAPETTAALAHQAAMQARSESDISTALLAEGWLLHGLLAVGRGATGVSRAVAALDDAARSGNSAAEARLRVGLASLARELGDGDSASALLAAVIERDIIDPELAVDAYLEAVRCGGSSVVGGASAAVDLAVGHIRTLRGEQVELGLAALDSALAAQHRMGGRNAAAVARAREGLRRLLGESAAGSELDPISPHLAATLSLELTRALLDDGQPELACRVAEPALAWAGRPAALGPLTRLRLVLAERAYLPAGQYDAALHAVGWAANVVGEHDLPELEADCQSLLADVHERRGALSDALVASRRAHRALRVHSARVEHALVLLGRCAGGAGTRPAITSVGWDPRGSVHQGFERGTGAPAPQRWARPGPSGLGVEANTATVRLRSVKREPCAVGPDIPAAAGSAQAELTRFEAAGAGAGRGNTEPVRYGNEPAGERNARPAAAMASSSLDDWAAVTGWPEEPSAGSVDPADTFGFGAVPPAFHRSEGIGAVSFSDRADLRGWTDVALTSAFGPVERADPAPIFDAIVPGGFGAFDEPITEPPADGEPTVNSGSRLPGDADGTACAEGDDLGELFDPDEQRPLGLVAIDVVAPKGPLTGHVAKPLLAHIAEQAHAQLPPNAGLRVLSSDVVLVVLPPVEADVVSRWMRSLATRLSARWSEYAADVPRSAYRVAIGVFDPGRSAADNVEQLRARLAGVPLQVGDDPDASVAGGRHVARGGSPSSNGARGVIRTTAGPGSGGRRRRPEGISEPVSASPPSPTAGTNGVVGLSSAHGDASSSESRESRSSPSSQRGAPVDSRSRGIDRVALARLTQMAWLPSTTIVGGVADAVDDVSESNGADSGGDAPGTGHGPISTGDGSPASGASENGSGENGVRPGGVGPVAAVNGVTAVTPPEGEAKDEPQRPWHAPSVSELSFAELLAGALAAYRDS